VSSEGVLVHRTGRVLEITLDRPEQGNEIHAAMFERILGAMDQAARDGLGVLRLRATGPAFCTGRERAGHDAVSIRQEVARLISLKRAIRTSPLICVAQVQGDAAGFGMGLAVLCDFAMVASTARLSFPEMRKGLPPAAIMAYLGQYGLPKRVFPMVLLARDFTPAQALEAGLISGVCAPDELAVATDDLVDAILAMDPDGVRQCKAYFQQALQSDVETNFRLATEMLTVESLRLRARAEAPPAATTPPTHAHAGTADPAPLS
jgi:methylglutaconyl-CoA hydratase